MGQHHTTSKARLRHPNDRLNPVGDMQLGDDVGGIVADGGTEHKQSSNIGVAAPDQIAPQARTASSSKTGPVGAVALDAAKKSIIRCNR
jgi:hypothetical protein